MSLPDPSVMLKRALIKAPFFFVTFVWPIFVFIGVTCWLTALAKAHDDPLVTLGAATLAIKLLKY